MISSLFNYFLTNDFLHEQVTVQNGDFNLKLYVPGYGKEDLQIEHEDDVLIIKSKDQKLLRSYRVPSEVESISATCDKGILELKMTKLKKEKKLISIL